MKTIIILLSVILSHSLWAQVKPLNSFDKIEAARAQNTISEADAAGLKVLAFMDIVNLPSEYQPDPGASGGPEDIQTRAAVKYLPEMSETIAPFVYRALIPEPFRPAPGTNKMILKADYPDPRFAPSNSWKFVDHTIANIRVWYETDEPGKEALAIMIKNLLADKIIEPTRKLMGRIHPSDADVNRTFRVRIGLDKMMPDGGDGKLDVYLGTISKQANARAAVFPYYLEGDGAIGCKATASYMAVDLGFARNAPVDRVMTTLAHEYFHTIQNSYNRKADCHSYDNSDEGTATYIKHHLFNKLNHEHEWFEYFEDGLEPFAEAAYGTWPFYLFMVQEQGENVLRELYEKEELFPDIEAINNVLKGGWKEGWPLFALYNWNQDPLQDSFVDWDKLTSLPGRGAVNTNGHKNPIKVEEVILGLDGTYRYNFQLDMKPLTRDFYAFDFSGQDIRSVSIDNPILFAAKKARAKVLIVKSNGQSVEELTWEDSKRHVYEYCLDNPDEKIEKIVIAITNYNHKPSAPNFRFGGAVKATNIGCFKYKGRARSQMYFASGKNSYYLDVQATDMVLKDSGRNEEGLFKGHFHLEKATVTYTFHAESDGCVADARGNLTPDTGDKAIALGVYPYNVAPDASGSYAFALITKEKGFKVTYVCPPPMPSFVAEIGADFSSSFTSHQGFDHFSGKETRGNFTNEWDLTPVRE